MLTVCLILRSFAETVRKKKQWHTKHIARPFGHWLSALVLRERRSLALSTDAAVELCGLFGHWSWQTAARSPKAAQIPCPESGLFEGRPLGLPKWGSFRGVVSGAIELAKR